MRLFTALLLLASFAPAGAQSQAWYLLTPPWSASLTNYVDARAPLTRWTVAEAFDSASSCHAALSLLRELQESHEILIRQTQEDKRRWHEQYGGILKDSLKGSTPPPDEGKTPDVTSSLPELLGQWRGALTTVRAYTPYALERGAVQDLIPLLRRM